MYKENIKKYALILAAGIGSRMNTELPKCAVNFCGKSMIKRIVAECKKCNFEEIIVIVGYKKENIMIETNRIISIQITIVLYDCYTLKFNNKLPQ